MEACCNVVSSFINLHRLSLFHEIYKDLWSSSPTPAACVAHDREFGQGDQIRLAGLLVFYDTNVTQNLASINQIWTISIKYWTPYTSQIVSNQSRLGRILPRRLEIL